MYLQNLRTCISQPEFVQNKKFMLMILSVICHKNIYLIEIVRI